MGLRVVDGERNGGLSRTGAAAVGLLILLGGCLAIGWGAATKYQSDLAALRLEIAQQGTEIGLILDHLGIPRPDRHQ